MSRLDKFVVAIAVIWFFGSTVFFSHRTPSTQFLTLPLFPCFLAAVILSIIGIFTNWRKRRWLALLPFTACVLSVVISALVTSRVRQAIFIYSLPSYEAIVHQMESGSIPVSAQFDSVPQAVPLARLAYAVFAQRETNGVLSVVFLTESGFPVKHSGYLYCSSGAIARDSIEDSDWPIRRQERPKWFYVSD